MGVRGRKKIQTHQPKSKTGLVCMVYHLPMNPTPPTSHTQIILVMPVILNSKVSFTMNRLILERCIQTEIILCILLVLIRFCLHHHAASVTDYSPYWMGVQGNAIAQLLLHYASVHCKMDLLIESHIARDLCKSIYKHG